MITARAALFQGRSLRSAGKDGETNSEGPNELLRQGARLASCAGDILKIYSLSSGIDLSKLSLTPTRDAKERLLPSKPADKADPAESRRNLRTGFDKIETAGKQDRYAGRKHRKRRKRFRSERDSRRKAEITRTRGGAADRRRACRLERDGGRHMHARFPF